MHPFSTEHWLIILIIWIFFLIPIWRIVRKAGYPGVLSLLAIVPLLNLILLWVFAFATWPIEQKAGQQKQ